ncbi:hypothetical protein Tco_1528865, partial [Tanacetum coccineum]
SIPLPSSSKDKGKAIMKDFEPKQATTKLKQRQKIAGYEASIRLQEQLNEKESQRIVKDAEVAQRLQEGIDASKRQQMKIWFNSYKQDLFKERFSITEPIDDKEKELWVELKRLFELDNDDTLWKLQSCSDKQTGRKILSIVKRSSDVDVGKQDVSRTTFRDGK